MTKLAWILVPLLVAALWVHLRPRLAAPLLAAPATPPPRPAPPVQAAAPTPPAMTEAVHRATSLRPAAARGDEGAGVSRRARRGGGTAAGHGAPAAVARGLRRAAAHRCAPLGAPLPHEPVPLQSLSDLPAAVQRHAEVLSGAVGEHVVAHAVQGLAEVAWRYDGLHHMLRPSPAAAPVRRSRTRAAALGLGVCAVGAFCDDEAAVPVGIDPALEWPVHFVTVGWPA